MIIIANKRLNDPNVIYILIGFVYMHQCRRQYFAGRPGGFLLKSIHSYSNTVILRPRMYNVPYARRSVQKLGNLHNLRRDSALRAAAVRGTVTDFSLQRREILV